jgi:hypothetical protein
MNKMFSEKFMVGARIFFALVAGIFLVPKIHAQFSQPEIENRVLFIFDTSADMKKRVPAEQKILETILFTSMSGQLRSGDSMGVWTFDQDLRTGQFPLQRWDSSQAAMITSNIMTLVGKQHYRKTTTFDTLQPALNQVVENSQRLTVLIFCDGEAPFKGTPFDAGINSVFQEKQSAQKKARQPFVVILRSQLGQFIGCTANFPPARVNIPEFPPLPLQEPPPSQPMNVPPSTAPAAEAPPLIIIGTKAGTNLPPPALAETNPAALTNQPPIEPLKPTNSIAAPPEISEATNSVAETNIGEGTNAIAQTNSIAAPSENSDSGGHLLAIAATCFIAACALGIFVRSRLKKPGSSLITRSMNEKK